MAKKSKKKALNDFFTDDVVEAPTEGASIFRTPDRQAQFYRWMLRGTIFVMLPLMAVVIFGMAAQQFMGGGDPPPDREESVSEYRPLAEEAVSQWIAEEPMPGLNLLGWSYSVTTEDRDETIAEMEEDDSLPDDPDEVASIDTVEVHYFNLTSSSGSFYTASVSVSDNPVEGARVTSDVSLVADEPMDVRAQQSGFDGDSTTEVTEGIARSAQSWSEAYYSADPSELKLAVGDGRDGYGYMPMPQAEEVEASVTDAAAHPAAETSEESPDPDLVYARVDVTVTWPLPEIDDEQAEAMEESGETMEPAEMTVSYDLLMEAADTQAPTVVAWGPVGEYEQLEPYLNAVEGREFESGELDHPEPDGESADPSQSTGDEPSDDDEEDTTDGDDGDEASDTDPDEIDEESGDSGVDDDNQGW